jgi:hypothetical protein
MLVSKSMNFSRKSAGNQAYMVTVISQYLGSFDTNYIICKMLKFSKIIFCSLRIQNLWGKIKTLLKDSEYSIFQHEIFKINLLFDKHVLNLALCYESHPRGKLWGSGFLGTRSLCYIFLWAPDGPWTKTVWVLQKALFSGLLLQKHNLHIQVLGILYKKLSTYTITRHRQ